MLYLLYERDLKVEDGGGAGFVSLPIEELGNQPDSEPKKFAIVFADKVGGDLVQEVKNLFE